MLKRIKAVFKKISQPKPVFDPSVFNDSLAVETQWTPLKGGGSNFQTHKLAQAGYSRLEFKATSGAKLFSGIFMCIGLAVPVWLGIDSVQKTGELFQSEFLFAVLFGLIFFGAGSFMFYSFSKPVIFDKTMGMYWKGWKTPKGYLARDSVDEGSRIVNIHAIQLLAEFVRSDKKPYYSYELNLVLKDGSRMNVIDHGSYVEIREDAKLLSEFLGVPVWDAVNA